MNGTLARVAMALLIDYSSVYYIDLKTNHYECYSTNQGYKKLELQSSGDDFFVDCQRDIRAVIYDEDWEMLSAALSRESLLRQLRDQDKISIVYRLLIGGRPVYHTMRILHDASGVEDCLILGVLNVDEAMRAEQATRTYSAIAKTLADGYATIYHVDLATNHYVEYSSSNDYKDLEVPPEGNDFFTESAKNVVRFIHPEDQQRVLRVFEKPSIMALTEHGRKYQTEYRLMMNGEAHYVRLMAVRAGGGENLIIALDNIDEEARSRQELKDISERSVIFTHIAESLANQYGMIYYIDTQTDEYIEFTATDEYKELNISPTGSDFFGTSQRNVSMIVHPSDRERVFDALNKQTMMRKLRENGSFTMTYQLLLPEGSAFTRMSVFWANDRKHLIMAVMNIDNEIERENAIKKMVQENAIFSQIAESLANQYDTIYYVDMLTDHYIEFSSTDVYKSLDVRPSGDDFFSESLRNIERVIHPEDRLPFQRILSKPTLVQMLQGKHMITHSYRLLIDQGIMYARLSVIWATDNKHLIIGVMNIDDEVRREREVQAQLHVANEKAYRDDLTGVKNKGAYKELEEQMQAAVDEGNAKDFSIVVCDVNGLKTINDRYGHIAGDTHIKKASELICRLWAHSPVFRVGGDEFVVVPQGENYDDREAIMARMRGMIEENRRRGDVVIAAGMADFDRASDTTVAQVFERADGRMYENKSALKASGRA